MTIKEFTENELQVGDLVIFNRSRNKGKIGIVGAIVYPNDPIITEDGIPTRWRGTEDIYICSLPDEKFIPVTEISGLKVLTDQCIVADHKYINRV